MPLSHNVFVLESNWMPPVKPELAGFKLSGCHALAEGVPPDGAVLKAFPWGRNW